MASNLHIETLKQKAKNLPLLPGVYQYFNATGDIIYIGKAKKLRNRVLSYFTKSHTSGKLLVMVSKIRDIKHIIVETEQDALLLENSLIKTYQPRYNIQLKDDKTYPWICIKKEPFPRVFITRKRVKDGSLYFGPYTSVKLVRSIMDVILSIYQFRTCRYDLSSEKITKGNYKVCLEYHINNCRGACVGKQTEVDYMNNIEAVKQLLRGNMSSLMRKMREQMGSLAGELRFEEAEQIKNKLYFLERYQNRSVVVSSTLWDMEVYSFVEEDKWAYVNMLTVVEGRVVNSYTLEIKNNLEERKEDLLLTAIIEIRQRMNSKIRDLVLPFPVEYNIPQAKIHIPQRGEKMKLLQLSKRNLLYFKKEKNEQKEKRKNTVKRGRVLRQAKKDLNMKEIPRHIECFDNSNIQGTNPVASCVVFKNGKPAKKEYRKYHIKTVVGVDDFASMREVIHRRYSHLLSDKQPLPQLIIIDGGKGQLGAAYGALKELGMVNKVRIISIAKRLEELYFPNDPTPLYLDKRSETLKLIQNLRNEAHRFAITFHRSLRLKSTIGTVLDNIPGVGEKTIKLLLQNFKSVAEIKIATKEELTTLVGKAKAGYITDYFKKNSQE